MPHGLQRLEVRSLQWAGDPDTVRGDGAPPLPTQPGALAMMLAPGRRCPWLSVVRAPLSGCMNKLSVENKKEILWGPFTVDVM